MLPAKSDTPSLIPGTHKADLHGHAEAHMCTTLNKCRNALSGNRESQNKGGGDPLHLS